MKTFLTFLLGTALLGAAAGDSAASVRKNLERMPRPWQNPAYHPAPEDETYEGGGNTAVIDKLNWERYEAVLRDWAEQYDFFTLEELGRTFENDPIYLVKITSPGVPADQKFRIALTSLHTGSERSPLYALMAAMEFLCSPEAQKYRDRYEIAIVPSGNPYGFFRTEEFSPWNSRKVIPYAPPESDWDIRNLSFKKIADSPEIAAFCKLIDDFQPEIQIDWHGVGRHIPGEIMHQYINSAGSNHTLAGWSNLLDEAMLSSAVRAGHSLPRYEESLQRLKSVTAAGQAFPRRFRESKELFYTDLYPYLKYHTMPLTMEIAYEGMAVAALRGLLDFGLNPPTELNGSLPVDNLRTDFGGLTVGGKRNLEKDRIADEIKPADIPRGAAAQSGSGGGTFNTFPEEHHSGRFGLVHRGGAHPPQPGEFPDHFAVLRSSAVDLPVQLFDGTPFPVEPHLGKRQPRPQQRPDGEDKQTAGQQQWQKIIGFAPYPLVHGRKLRKVTLKVVS